MTPLSAADLLLSVIGVASLYSCMLVIYRLYLSPLSKFPGPRLAAATLWYEFYYDVIKHGRYTWKLAELHAEYGPIIRISPHELHIDDPDYYEELYVGFSVRRTMKYEWFIRGFGPSVSAFSTLSHELHRTRRSPIAPYFSRASVQQLEPSVQAMIDKLTARLDTVKGTGAVVNLRDMYSSLTADIICQYCFATPYGFLDMDDFKPDWHNAIMDFTETTHFFKQFPWVEAALGRIPPSMMEKVVPRMGAMLKLKAMVCEKISKVQDDVKKGNQNAGQKSILSDMIASDQLAPQDKSPARLEAEGLSLATAGSMTVAHTLSVIHYHVIDNPNILRRLQDELSSAMSKSGARPRWNQLEQLPYLSAVIQEGLRWGYGVSHRLQRISPDVALQYNDWIIPKGTPVGMTSVFMHNNEEHFPEPRIFNPERWLQQNALRLRKYMVPFSKGSRQCLGMSLAYCELYLTLAAVFAPGRFNFSFHETDISDVEIAHDFFNACQRKDSKGIRMTVN